MTWSKYHKESQKLAIEAEFALANGKQEEALKLYRNAAEFEEKSLNELDDSKIRTKGITVVSAVALWYKAEEFTRAEQLAYSNLGDSSLIDFARDELRNLVQVIWTEVVKREAQVKFLPGQVTVSLSGGEVVTGGAPLDLIVEKVQSIQAIFYRTIEMIKSIPHRRTGPPRRDIQNACRPWIFQAVPSSYQFSVAVQRPSQMDFFAEDVNPREITDKFMKILTASISDASSEIENLVPDEDYRITFQKLIRNLSPAKEGKAFSKIKLRSPDIPNPVVLDVDSRFKINKHIKEISDQTPEVIEKHEELQGTLRAVHLDKDWIEIHDRGGKSVRIRDLKNTVDDVIGPMVNKQVIVKVRINSKNEYLFTDIEIDE